MNAPIAQNPDDSIVAVFAKDFLASQAAHATRELFLREEKLRKQDEQLSIHLGPAGQPTVAVPIQNDPTLVQAAPSDSLPPLELGPSNTPITTNLDRHTLSVSTSLQRQEEQHQQSHGTSESESKRQTAIRSSSQSGTNMSLPRQDSAENAVQETISSSSIPVEPAAAPVNPISPSTAASITSAPTKADPPARLSPVSLALKLNAELANLEAVEATRVKVRLYPHILLLLTIIII